MAGNLSLTETYDRVRATTESKVLPKVWDNITANQPTIHYLYESRSIEFTDGGAFIEPIVFKEVVTAVGAAATEKITAPYVDPVTRARYAYKNLYAPFKVSGVDLAKNTGNTAEVNLMETIAELSERSLIDGLGNSTIGVWSDAGETNEGAITGLRGIIKPSGTNSSGTTGTIARSNSWWQNQTGTAITAFATDGRLRWLETASLCNRGNEKPDAIVTTRAQWVLFVNSLTGTVNTYAPIEQRVSSTGSYDYGTPDYGFFGARVFFDAAAEANTARFLNSKYLKLIVNRNRNLRMREAVLVADEDAIILCPMWQGNLVAKAIARLGYVSGGDA